MAQSQVYSLLQDSRGYMWMGTRGGGITKFDGINFKTFTVKDGLVNNYVFCIKEDQQHNLWIGTNSGFSKYNGLKFVNFKPAVDSAQVAVNTIAFDSRKRKWLATNVGLLYYDDKGITNVSQLLNDKREYINTVFVDKDDNVWYGSAFGLFRLSEKNQVFTKIKYDKNSGFPDNSVSFITQDKNGNLWIGTHGDGAYVYNGSQFYRIDHKLELYKQTVWDIYFDNHNNVWMATLNHGVAQYNLQSKTFNWITEEQGLGNNHVRSVIQDNSGNYWFGTSGGGVCNYFGKQFTVYDKSSGLGGNFIYSVFRDSKSRLWCGTSDKGVTAYDSARFTVFNALSGFADLKVKSINQDNSGNIYFGTEGQGLFIYDGVEFRQTEELKKTFIRNIVKDKEGDMWIATAGAGLFRIKANSNTGVENYTLKDGLLSMRINCLHFDKKGRLWYGTDQMGIGLLINNQVQKTSITTREGLVGNNIRCFAEDKDGFLWVGTADGISSFDLYNTNSRIYNYDHKTGLTSSNIYLITVDEKNTIITGSETGLDHIFVDAERKIQEVKHYSKGEGFTGIETCQNSVYNDTDGDIWFGTINGLIKYNPANRVSNANPPVTTINNVNLFYKPIAETGFNYLVKDWNTFSKLTLPHDQNHITFNFTGINFSNPEAVKYQWKLEGFDKTWSPVSKENNIVYSNLSPGTYTFLVKAGNEDNIWNPQPTRLTFTITRPFWQKWWFITLLFLMTGGTILFLFRWRVNRIKLKAREQQDKLQMEKEIVELEQKALRLQMNPHFIFNALNSIQSQIGTDNEQAARYYLAKFSRLMRQILDNSRNPLITLEEEVNMLENYLLVEKFCNGDRFDYKISVDENIEKDYLKIPPMLLQPFIENAIKHGLKFIDGKRGYIEVTFIEKNGLLECSVTDNGVGRKKAAEINSASKETYHTSTALIVTKERLDLMKEDTSNALEIIDLYDENKKASGTRVMIRIPVN